MTSTEVADSMERHMTQKIPLLQSTRGVPARVESAETPMPTEHTVDWHLATHHQAAPVEATQAASLRHTISQSNSIAIGSTLRPAQARGIQQNRSFGEVDSIEEFMRHKRLIKQNATALRDSVASSPESVSPSPAGGTNTSSADAGEAIQPNVVMAVSNCGNELGSSAAKHTDDTQSHFFGERLSRPPQLVHQARESTKSYIAEHAAMQPIKADIEAQTDQESQMPTYTMMCSSVICHNTEMLLELEQSLSISVISSSAARMKGADIVMAPNVGVKLVPMSELEPSHICELAEMLSPAYDRLYVIVDLPGDTALMPADFELINRSTAALVRFTFSHTSCQVRVVLKSGAVQVQLINLSAMHSKKRRKGILNLFYRAAR